MLCDRDTRRARVRRGDVRRADANLIREDFRRRGRKEPPAAVAADDLEPDELAVVVHQGVHGSRQFGAVHPDGEPE